MSETENNEVTTAYKGFDKEMKCLGFAYKVGESYHHKDRVKACSSGFHACEQPLSVFCFYPPTNGNRFAVVEQSGYLDKENNKTASEKIKIKAEIGVAWIIKAAVEWTKRSSAKPTTGNYAHSATTGESAHSATTGDSANSATTGNYAHSATTGNYANSATTGNYANSATTGNYAHSATTGYYAHSATTGYYAHSATTGNYAHSATTGNYAHSATTGNYAHSATTGYSANSATTGYSANSEAKGLAGAAFNAGNGAAKAGKDGAIAIVERDDRLNILAVFASKVGENGIKPDTWYKLKSGQPVEVSL